LARGRQSVFDALRDNDDEIGVETAINEINIEQYIPQRVSISELARLGIDFGFLLLTEIEKSKLSGRYRVVLSVMPEDSALKVGATCIVRFYKLRENQVWESDNLEDYRLEAIATIDA
jgi:hypothetical protein